jgi:phosphohistidine phosphatase
LTPNARPKKLARYLLKTGGDKVAVVGHMPHLGDFTAWIIGGKKAQIEVPKAGVVLVTMGEAPVKGCGALRWISTPEWY